MAFIAAGTSGGYNRHNLSTHRENHKSHAKENSNLHNTRQASGDSLHSASSKSHDFGTLQSHGTMQYYRGTPSPRASPSSQQRV